ncbi:putative transporter [Dunaliella salina]|uniref:Transmembrane 9 superfamily member n=1 Tax=Dunaliella salina TaxID=3046 RepID=A0ABQ7H4P6_DUNSA|nr:putative transporter [Dunaliella salina]|eukprot:KAF5841834.1 putative transporter [Dunaliella salina]
MGMGELTSVPGSMARRVRKELFMFIIWTLLIVGSDAREFKQGQSIPVFANRVGPYHNPTETYQYYNLPFCQPSGGKEYKLLDLGEVLEGDRLVSTPYDMKFREDRDNQLLCKKHLSREDVQAFRDAVKGDYYFQMYLDDLPVWGFIGKVEKRESSKEERYFLFTHFHYDLLYNKNNVIEVDVSSDPLRTVDITSASEMEVEFSYSVKWRETKITYEHRMDRYARYSFLKEHLEVSVPQAVFKSSIACKIELVCALLFPEGAPGGYVSGTWFKMLGGHNWVANVMLTAVLWFGPVTAVFSYLNTVAIFYRSTAALPFGTIVIIIFLWSLITFPLTVLGGIAAKNSKAEFNAPCRTTKFPREVPPLPWYRTTIPQMAMAGFLPFSAIYIELYYIFASIWGYKVYTIYSVLFIVFIILVIVTAFVTVALTYFQLAVEDHRWWWRSFLCGGSTGFFIFGYCIYYYFYRSQMSGLMQTSFFFGYNALVCYAFLMMLGSIGFRASLLFVRHIYRAIKCE